jgi:glyceraldehyde 3-phosphate dehydrogenase
VTVRIGINGFGRIGRLFFRAAHANPQFQIVGINDLFPPASLAYLLEFDSIHGRFDAEVGSDEGAIIVNGTKIPTTAQKDPAALDWGALGVDYVLESTGLFTDFEGANKHVTAGERRVIISAPAKSDDVQMFVYGVNHELFDPAKHIVVSNASCTTNCLAPLAHVIDDAVGIEAGLMTTVHAITATQPTQDGPSKKDLRGGRAGGFNIIPASTGAARAVGAVLPQLKGKLTGMALRIPTPDVSVVDLTVLTRELASYADICGAVKAASEDELKGILGYTDQPVVSTDFIHDSRSSIFDQNAGMSLNPRFHKFIAWYDNEWGYSCRLVDLMVYMAEHERKL